MWLLLIILDKRHGQTEKGYYMKCAHFVSPDCIGVLVKPVIIKYWDFILLLVVTDLYIIILTLSCLVLCANMATQACRFKGQYCSLACQ